MLRPHTTTFPLTSQATSDYILQHLPGAQSLVFVYSDRYVWNDVIELIYMVTVFQKVKMLHWLRTLLHWFDGNRGCTIKAAPVLLLPL